MNATVITRNQTRALSVAFFSRFVSVFLPRLTAVATCLVPCDPPPEPPEYLWEEHNSSVYIEECSEQECIMLDNMKRLELLSLMDNLDLRTRVRFAVPMTDGEVFDHRQDWGWFMRQTMFS